MIDIAVLRAMAAAGASIEVILLAVEEDQKREAGRKAKGRERTQKWRDKKISENRASRDVTVMSPPSLPLKEKVPPAPPLKENNPFPPEEPPSQASLARPPAGATQKGCRLPVNWKPSAVDIDFARARIGQQWHIEADKFADYWHARAGPNGVKLDWPATWRNWVRKAQENGQRHGHQKPDGREHSVLAVLDDLFGPKDAGQPGRRANGH